MMKHYCLVVLHCLVVCCWFFRSLGVLSNSTTDSLEFGQEMKDWECLVSSNGQFQLGFFNSPNGSTNRYLGILATKIYGGDGNKTVVWVANRANPLTDDTSGVLKITQEGKLMINDSRGISFTLNSQQNFTMRSNTIIIISARLDDTGNFVLRSSGDNNNNNIVWQSFDHPSHVWLQGMKLGLFNLKSGNPQHRFLTSWSSQQDPDPDGAFSLGVDPNNTKQQLIAWERSRGVVYWSSGMWNGYNFSSLLPEDYSYYYFPFNFSYISNENESYFTYYLFGGGTNNALIRLDSSGALYYLSENSHFNQVVAVKCDDPNNPGNNISPGCVKPNNASNCIGGNVFTETRKSTARNYTFSEKVNNNTTVNNNSKKKPLWTTIVGSYVSILIFISSCIWCYRRCRHQWFKGGNNKDGIVQGMQQLMDELNNSATTIDELSNAGKLKFRGQKDRELPFVSFSTIEIATGYFSETNKIGEGGYGPVYKGVLVNGQEIAVKRLSSKSRQGLKEFKNEVILISRLQHRNLVRLLGCCIQRDERILIYEYLSNKSLDFFLFDVTKQYLLDWKMRVSIIGGIAQGLLYLHKYSRLRIIHRDLKSSNILLDNDMNPKISDFGTARIFGDNENQANTDRIVGTYGYMSPEYAMDGLFSVKSDVFSFGVMMLEIISGKKNTGFYRPDRALNLLGYAWGLWKEEKGLELVDQAVVENCSISEAMRYIQVGFLCVQEIAVDRPNMLDVVSMLSNATMVLPAPKQPAFSKIMGLTNANAPTTIENFSINDVTISEVVVR